jgi:hypothetical protein
MGLLFVSCSTAGDKKRTPPPPEINASGTNMAQVPPWSETDLAFCLHGREYPSW